MKQFETLNDVVDWRLCIGCGVCSSVCPSNKVQLWDFFREGIRPVIDQPDCDGCRQCLNVCPAVQTDFLVPSSNSLPLAPRKESADHIPSPTLHTLGDSNFQQDWGQVIEVWEGYATDPEIRFKGSSGGALTALAAYCIERAGMYGVLHTGQHPADPIRNSTRLSRTQAELLAATGSRYSPASVCDSLGLVEQAPAPCVIIGKPGEIAAVRKTQTQRPEFSAKVGATFSFFCAESPSTAGTVALLAKMGIPHEAVGNLRYRGYGWPGHFAPTRKGESDPLGSDSISRQLEIPAIFPSLGSPSLARWHRRIG